MFGSPDLGPLTQIETTGRANSSAEVVLRWLWWTGLTVLAGLVLAIAWLVAVGLSKKCADCHNEVKWKETTFNHDKDTKFKLDGAHGKLECKKCHEEGKYKDTPRDCLSCHRKDDNGEKGHHGRFGGKCEKWLFTVFLR
jgi:hypothetical protein